MVDLLIVEDESLLASLLAEAAGYGGYSTEIARDGESALAFLDTQPGPPAFVLADVSMHPMDGLDLVRALRARPACAGIFIISTSGYPPDRDRAYEAGADCYLPKPFLIEELIAIMEQRTCP